MAVTARCLESQFRLIPAAIPVLVPPPPPVESTASEAVQRLRGQLEAQCSARLTSGAELVRALDRRHREEVVPTTIAAIDGLLSGGLPRGKMTEIAGRGARFSVAIATLASATSIGEAAALIDAGDHFDPQLGEAAGINLRRMLWVRPQTMKQAVAAAEMLVATGFQLVIFDVGPSFARVGGGQRPSAVRTAVGGCPPRSRPHVGRVPDAAWVRLARAAEAHGAALLVSAPYPLTGTTSVAMLRTEPSRGRWRGGLLIEVETTVRLEKDRRKRSGKSASVQFLVWDEFTANREPRTANS